MNLIERTSTFLAGMFLSLGLAHFEVIEDFDQAAFWVTGAAIICWGIGATYKNREKCVGLSAVVSDTKGS